MNPFIQKIASGDQPSFDQWVKAFSRTFPLVRELESTPQDPEWHAEGNVAIHTEAVLEAMWNILKTEATHLTDDQKLALAVGAFFHDIGKPLSTREAEIDGRIRIVSPRHADLGRNYLALRLLSLELPESVYRNVLALVGYHHDPRKLVEKATSKHQWTAAARRVDPELVYYLELADVRGRQCLLPDDMLDALALFRQENEKFGLWHGANPYEEWENFFNERLSAESSLVRQAVTARAIHSFESGAIWGPEEELARSYNYRSEFSYCHILCGVSGAGKSRWVAHHLGHHEVISLDAIREEMTGKREDQSKNGQVLQEALKRYKRCLAAKKPVCWDSTNIRRETRRKVVQLCHDYGGYAELTTVLAPPERILTANRKREHAVPESIVQKQIKGFEMPACDEAHTVSQHF